MGRQAENSSCAHYKWLIYEFFLSVARGLALGLSKVRPQLPINNNVYEQRLFCNSFKDISLLTSQILSNITYARVPWSDQGHESTILARNFGKLEVPDS